MAVRIGIIAEDMSDIEVLKILAKKVSRKTFSVSHFVGKGCGPLAKKTPGWCKNLWLKGCTHILLIHDLDRNNLADLRLRLETILGLAPQLFKAVVIPSEELEAWLLSDTAAISKALNLKKILKEIHHPEKVPSPKEHIGEMVRKNSNSQRTYVNTVHNRLIAHEMDINKIKAKCPSFLGFASFLK